MSKNINTFTAGRPSANSGKAKTLASVSGERDTKRVNIQLSVERHRKLKLYATRHDTTIKELFTEFIDRLPDS